MLVRVEEGVLSIERIDAICISPGSEEAGDLACRIVHHRVVAEVSSLDSEDLQPIAIMGRWVRAVREGDWDADRGARERVRASEVTTATLAWVRSASFRSEVDGDLHEAAVSGAVHRAEGVRSQHASDT